MSSRNHPATDSRGFILEQADVDALRNRPNELRKLQSSRSCVRRVPTEADKRIDDPAGESLDERRNRMLRIASPDERRFREPLGFVHIGERPIDRMNERVRATRKRQPANHHAATAMFRQIAGERMQKD